MLSLNFGYVTEMKIFIQSFSACPIFDELVKSQEFHFGVIPAKAGIQSFQ